MYQRCWSWVIFFQDFYPNIWVKNISRNLTNKYGWNKYFQDSHDIFCSSLSPKSGSSKWCKTPVHHGFNKGIQARGKSSAALCNSQSGPLNRTGCRGSEVQFEPATQVQIDPWTEPFWKPWTANYVAAGFFFFLRKMAPYFWKPWMANYVAAGASFSSEKLPPCFWNLQGENGGLDVGFSA